MTETAGAIGGSAATLVGTQVGTGNAGLAIEDVIAANALASASCSFGVATTWWRMICDAVVPATQTVTVTLASTDSNGNALSQMIAGASITLSQTSGTAASIACTAGSVPGSGYLRVMITGPAAGPLTIRWGAGSPTDFQVTYTSRSG